MRRRSVVALACVGVLVVGGGAAVGSRYLWQNRCGAGSDSVDPADVGLPSFTAPSAAPGDLRALVSQAGSLRAPFGTLRSVAMIDREDSRPTVVSVTGSDAMIATASGPPGGWTSGALSRVRLPDGRPVWSRGFAGYAPGGSTYRDHYLSFDIPKDRAPEVSAYDLSDGERQWCAKLGEAVETDWRPTFDSVPVGDDLFVVRPSDAEDDDDDRVRLSRLSLDGDIRWDRPLDGVDQVSDVSALDDLLVVTRYAWDARDKVLQQASQPGDVRAYAADGSARWSFDARDDGVRWVSGVAAVHRPSRTILVERVAAVTSPERGYRHRLVALDPAGKVRWTKQLSGTYSTMNSEPLFQLEGDTVVFGERSLTGISVTDGSPRWTVPSTPVTDRRTLVQFDLAAGTTVDGTYLVPEYKRIVAVDLASNAVRSLPVDVPFSAIDVTDDHLLVTTRNAYLVFDRA